jgi:hypothetical protein
VNFLSTVPLAKILTNEFSLRIKPAFARHLGQTVAPSSNLAAISSTLTIS